MQELQSYNNAKLIYDLYQYVDQKIQNKFVLSRFIKSVNYSENFFVGFDEQVNSLTKKYKNKLFPVLVLLRDFEIMLFEGKYVLIEMDVCFENIPPENIYSTPEEVWEKAILPEIESVGFWDKIYLDYDKE